MKQKKVVKQSFHIKWCSVARIKAKGKSLSDALAVKVPSLERARFKVHLISEPIFSSYVQKRERPLSMDQLTRRTTA
jgi:hypothetical protein